MQFLQPKKTTETVFYTIDYSSRLVGDSIDIVTLERTSGETELTKKVNSTTAIGFMLSGGADDEVSQYSIEIQTVYGQIIRDEMSIITTLNPDILSLNIVTKQVIVEAALENMRLSSYIFDNSPALLNSLLRKLDMLMYQYHSEGFDLLYNLPDKIGGSLLNDIAGIDQSNVFYISQLLAYYHIESMGKQLSPQMIIAKDNAYNKLYLKTHTIPSVKLSHSTPVGAGNKWFYWFPFFNNYPTSSQQAILIGMSGSYVTQSIWDDARWN